MLVGTPPFYSRNLQTMYRAILHGELRFPASMSKPARSLLVGLLCRDASHRLGSNGDARQVQRHAFFRSLDFKRVYARGYEPSFRPQLTSSEDTTNFDTSFTNESVADSLHDPSDLERVERENHIFDDWETFRAAPSARPSIAAVEESAASVVALPAAVAVEVRADAGATQPAEPQQEQGRDGGQPQPALPTNW